MAVPQAPAPITPIFEYALLKGPAPYD